MSMWKCNSCGGTYSDADGYKHVCHDLEVKGAEVDATGKVTTPEKRVPRTSIRNENLDSSVVFSDDKYVRRVPNPEERGQTLEVPAEPCIISEGKGRMLVE